MPQYISASEKVAISLIRGNNSFLRCLDEMKICDELPDERELMICLDWNRLVPVFYTSVVQSKLLEDYFSSEFLLELKTYYRSSVLHSMQLEGVFWTIAPLLQDEGIDFIPFKGIVLAQQVYPTPPLRPMLDIDILVDPKNVDKTKEILIRNNCTPLYEVESKHTMGQWRHIPPLLYRDVPIEIHQRLFLSHEEMFLQQEELIANTSIENILGYQLRTLSPEHHLFYLIYHLQKHAEQGYIKLIWLLDIRLFWEKFRSSINMEEVERLLNQSKGLYNSIAAIQEILNCKLIEIPETANIKEINQTIRFFLSRCNNRGLKTERIKSIEVLKKRNTLKSKLWFIVGRLFPKPSYIKSTFNIRHKILVPFCYPLLYLRYIQKLIRVVLAKVRGIREESQG